MKYACLMYQEEGRVRATHSPEAFAQLVEDVYAHIEEMKARGHYIWSTPLESIKNATTVRVRDGRMTITDGPFAETKEQLGGLFVIEARDLNEAIRIASGMPLAPVSSIEIRALIDPPARTFASIDNA